MKRVLGIIFSALLFGVIAGGSMVGINYLAQSNGIYHILAEGELSQSAEAETKEEKLAQPKEEQEKKSSASDLKEEKTVVQSRVGSVSQVAKEAMPSVVAITNMMRYQENGFSIFGDIQRESEYPASGSGVIVGKNETELLIATNNHVIQDSNSLSVSFIDDSTVNAQVKGTDATVDLALVSVKLTDLSPETREKIKVIEIGSSDAMEVGDQVVAIGNALGYGQSVTTGIISAKDRDVETKDGTAEGLLQTDAAINPGNSGGALLNMQGELIGINVAKYSDTDVEGMGYSIPSSKAESILKSLSTLATREDVPKDQQGVLGVQVKNIDAQTAESFAMPKGVYIFKILEDTGANNSELQERDIVTKLDGQGIATTADLKSLLSKYRIGEELTLTVMRQDGSGKYNEVQVHVTLGKANNTDYGTGSGSSGNQKGGYNSQEEIPQESPEGSGGDSAPSEEQQGSSQEEDELYKQFKDFFNGYKR
jgi:S1 family peptidase